jgi:hypothetical protein
LERYGPAIDSGKNIVTAVAIVATAAWFFRRRLRFPRARVEHAITARQIGNGYLLVRIQAKIENVGDVLMRLENLCLYIQQVRPLDSSIAVMLESDGSDPIPAGECELPWPTLVIRDHDWHKKPLEIEPGELETCNFDAILSDSVETIQVYTHIENRVKWFKKIGWNETSIYDISTESTVATTNEARESPRPEVTTATTAQRLEELSMADELKKIPPVKDRPPLTQGPKKQPVIPTSPPKKR